MTANKGVRATICTIISEMLDNPDQYGIYQTTRCYDKLEAYITERDKAIRRNAFNDARRGQCYCEDLYYEYETFADYEQHLEEQGE